MQNTVDWGAELYRKLEKTGQASYYSAPTFTKTGYSRYQIETRDGYVFDGSFWRTFREFPFEILSVRSTDQRNVALEWSLAPGANTPMADHHWRSSSVNGGWSEKAYPLGLTCNRCDKGLLDHPIQPGHVLPSGQYDPAQA
jgi:hypothetical protein